MLSDFVVRSSCGTPSLVALVVAIFLSCTAAVARAEDPNDRYHRWSILVRFQPETPRERREELVGFVGGELAKAYPRIPGLQLVRLHGMEPTVAARVVAANAEVRYAQPNFLYRFCDPDYDKQWWLKNTGQTMPHDDQNGQAGIAGADINAEAAWQATTGDPDIIVAVLDSGFETEHMDFGGPFGVVIGHHAMMVNWVEFYGTPNVDDDSNEYIDDYCGWNFVDDNNDVAGGPLNLHGTAVAGLIGALHNTIGVRGIAPMCRVLPILTYPLDSQIIDGLAYAIERGARIANMSFAGYSFLFALEDALKDAHDAGILVVASACNDGIDCDQTPSYPACYDIPNVVAVAATDNRDRLADWGGRQEFELRRQHDSHRSAWAAHIHG